MKGCLLVGALLIGALAAPAKEDKVAKSSHTMQCVDVPSEVCLGSGQQKVVKDAADEKLVGLWTFDDKYGADHSTGGNHPLKPPRFGPGFAGHGNSAWFDGFSGMEVPNSPAFKQSDCSFTVSFWMFLLQDSIGTWRTILHKGGEGELTPQIMLWPKSRRIHARVSTEANPNEGIDSVAIVPLRRWTHVAFVVQGRLLQLFVNGMLDGQVVTDGSTVQNKGPLYVGKDKGHPGAQMFLDELKWVNRASDEKEIRAEAAQAMPGLGNNFMRLGCHGCNFETAVTSCPATYHICTIRELYGGGFQIANSMGWFGNTDRVWTRNSTTAGSDDDRRLGLCCSDA